MPLECERCQSRATEGRACYSHISAKRIIFCHIGTVSDALECERCQSRATEGKLEKPVTHVSVVATQMLVKYVWIYFLATLECE